MSQEREQEQGPPRIPAAASHPQLYYVPAAEFFQYESPNDGFSGPPSPLHEASSILGSVESMSQEQLQQMYLQGIPLTPTGIPSQITPWLSAILPADPSGPQPLLPDLITQKSLTNRQNSLVYDGDPYIGADLL